ncbi:MAG: LamB/YcsF family protein, partial [Singulisphaera sp.]
QPRSIDLNADLGEGAPHDAELMDRITSASICCGAHAGDRATILDTLLLATARGVCIGGHPGYADREAFGRRERAATATEVQRLILDQVRDLDRLAAEVGLTLRFLKPHGALYNQAQRQPEIVRGVLDAAACLQLPVLGQPGSLLHAEAALRGVRYLTEGFADRRYQADGRLVPRGEPNAFIDDPTESKLRSCASSMRGSKPCLHGDDPRASPTPTPSARSCNVIGSRRRALSEMGLLVVHPGLHATVQDRGRTGYREWGVPVAGAFDQGASDLANALLGNSADCAVLELTLVGGTFEAQIPLAIALAGAPMRAAIVRRDGRERPLAIPQCAPSARGSPDPRPFAVGGTYVSGGARGWQTPLCSGAVRARTGCEQATSCRPTRGSPHSDDRRISSRRAGPRPHRVVDAPDAPPGFAWEAWEAGTFPVGHQSDRMGLRLDGDVPLVPPSPDRLSTPVAPGAIQIAGGRALILGVACGTMGGYPHVAHVITADLDRIGQARPGDFLRFRRIELAEARRIDRRERLARAGYLRCVAALAADAHDAGRD